MIDPEKPEANTHQLWKLNGAEGDGKVKAGSQKLKQGSCVWRESVTRSDREHLTLESQTQELGRTREQGPS